MERLSRSFEQLYLVEHLLLRSARRVARPIELPFIYGFSLSAVLSAAPSRVRDPAWRSFAARVVRQNVPAHLELSLLFLEPLEMVEFEDHYWRWRTTLAVPEDPRARALASAALRDFLVAHEEAGP